ncbi:type IV pilus biogenesis protein PilM [Natranaerofaba carboxydovora]|uniref:type IV pilus biogenesis protein PilM n=1 Tax=Natranaerofaba carboxydovora TaxID=2742683 RepID=UPI001F1309D4|nr:pilus assembly protein PilM [Natranaerofaba carboxydovora]UMZ73513.1 Type IV pilus assembly protein PilM [Natranaerofaba carboxydovora]
MLKKLLGKKNIIGLEINDKEIKAVELSERKGQIDIVNFGSKNLPKGAVKEGIVVKPDIVGQTLAELWQESKFKERNVVMGLANQNVLVRFTSFPKVDKSKLDNMIKYQASEYMPVSLDKDTVVFDYSIIGETVQSDNDMWEVLMVAGKRDMIDGFITSLKIAGLNPKEIEVLPLSLLGLLNVQNEKKVVAIVDISYGISNLLIVDSKKPRLARMMPTAYEDESEEESEDEKVKEDRKEDEDKDKEKEKEESKEETNEDFEMIGEKEVKEKEAEAEYAKNEIEEGKEEAAASVTDNSEDMRIDSEDELVEELDVEIIDDPEAYINEEMEEETVEEPVNDMNQDDDEEIKLFLAKEERELEEEKIQEETEEYMDTWNFMLVNNIRVSVDFYQSRGSVEPVEKILLCGKNTDDENLISSIESQVGVDVEVIDPLKVLAINNSVDKDINATEYSLCLCLAYNGLEV